MSYVMGIYQVRNLVNGKRYVGQSIYLHSRMNYHLHHLERGTHFIPHLQNSYNLYGKRAFVTEVLEVVEDRKDLNDREIHYIDKYGTLCPSKGYNRARGGGAASRHVSEETRRRISEGISRATKGKPRPKHTEETKRKISEAQIGKVVSPETRRRMSESAKKKVFTKEHRRNMGKAKLGRRWTMSEQGRQNCRVPKSVPWTDAQRQAMSERVSGEGNPMYGVRGEDHWAYGKISITRNGEDQYIDPSELSSYKSQGWVAGRSCGESISRSKSKWIYEYGGMDFYGWRKLQRYLVDVEGREWISQSVIGRLSVGKVPKNPAHQDLVGKITYRSVDEDEN